MSTDSTPKLPEPLRTVSESTGDRPDTEMHTFGLLMAAIMLVLMIPLLPIIAVIWLVSTGIDVARRTVGGGGDEPRRGRRPVA